MEHTMIEVIVKQGVGVFCVIAGTYFLWYMIKNGVVDSVKATRNLSESVVKLVVHINEFSANVKRDHSDHLENQKKMQENQKELSLQLKEVTTTLGRINGYKKE